MSNAFSNRPKELFKRKKYSGVTCTLSDIVSSSHLLLP